MGPKLRRVWEQDVGGGDRSVQNETKEVAWQQVVQVMPGKSWTVLFRGPRDMVFKMPLGFIHKYLVDCLYHARYCRRSS